MADVSKFKRASRLGPPPTVDEASPNLTAPEVAPAMPAASTAEQAAPSSYRRRDGRSARKTHRTLPLALRVSPSFDERLRDIAQRDGLLLVEVLEQALEAYEARRTR
jgi:hypothetical protein